MKTIGIDIGIEIGLAKQLTLLLPLILTCLKNWHWYCHWYWHVWRIDIGIAIAIDLKKNWYWYCHWYCFQRKIDIAIAIDIDKGKNWYCHCHWYWCLWEIDIAIDIDIETWKKLTLILPLIALLLKLLILPLPLKIFEATIDIAIDRKILLLLMSASKLYKGHQNLAKKNKVWVDWTWNMGIRLWIFHPSDTEFFSKSDQIWPSGSIIEVYCWRARSNKWCHFTD